DAFARRGFRGSRARMPGSWGHLGPVTSLYHSARRCQPWGGTVGSVLGKRMFARLGSGVAVGVAIAIALPPTAAQAAPAPKLAVFVPNATAPAQDTEAVSLIAVASTDSQPVELRGLTVLVDAA